MAYCSSLQILVISNFSEIESTFPVLFGDCVADCWWLCGIVSICLIRKGKYDWFFHKGLLLDWILFLLYLLQFVRCSKHSSKVTNFSILTLSLICRANQWTAFYMITASVMKELNLILHFLHLFVLKHSHCLLKF